MHIANENVVGHLRVWQVGLQRPIRVAVVLGDHWPPLGRRLLGSRSAADERMWLNRGWARGARGIDKVWAGHGSGILRFVTGLMQACCRLATMIVIASVRASAA